MSTISSGSSGLTWTSDNSSNLAITLTSIVDNTGNTVSGSTVVNGSAKAWVNFNGTGTVAIRSSFNVSSITDNGTGDYTVNFTTAMPNANYTALGSTIGANNFSVGWATNITNSSSGTNTKTTSACRIRAIPNNDGAAVDPDSVNFIVFSS